VTRLFATQSRDEVQQVIGCASPDADAEWLVAEGVHESGAHMALSIAVSPLYAANGMMVGALVAVRKPSSAHSAAAETNPLVDSAQRTTPDSAPTVEDADLRNDWDAERINLALAAARLGDWSWDACTDMVTFSPRAAELFGIPSGRAMTRTAMREFMHPEDREAARIAVDRAIATRGDYGIEYRLINSGRERWISASGRARYDHRGEVLGMFGVVQDISKDRLLLRVDDAVRPLVKPEDITYTAARTLGQYLQVNR